MGKSFHAYPSVAQYIDSPPNLYSRSVPLACDTLEWDTTGCFDLINHCFVANVAMIVDFHAMVLWDTPNLGASVNVWLFKNVLPPPDGSTNGEMCGDDVVVFQPGGFGGTPPGVKMNTTARISRRMKLAAGDKVWAVPGCAGGGQLTNACNGGENTVNYFEGEIIEYC